MFFFSFFFISTIKQENQSRGAGVTRRHALKIKSDDDDDDHETLIDHVTFFLFFSSQFFFNFNPFEDGCPHH